ncbi:hypothetical protein P879_06886, partial [Paragonimus westermani]
LLLEQAAYEIGSQRSVAFNFTQGSNITGQLTLDGQSRTVQVDEDQKRVLSEPISVLAPAQMAYVLTLSNLLGSENISGVVDFVERISGIQIEQTVYEVGAQRNVAFSFTKGSSIAAQLTLNGQSRTVQIDEHQKRIVSETISVMHPIQMTYLLKLGNSLGSFNQSGTVEFMERITGEFF